MTTWREDKRATRRLERIGVEELRALTERDPSVQIMDVREPAEWNAGHIPGSRPVPWRDISGIPDGLNGARAIAVICASGQRALTAASLLQGAGAANVLHIVDGGVPTWERLGFPLEASEETHALQGGRR
jgi:rhodanese-related sulfurtransferase